MKMTTQGAVLEVIEAIPSHAMQIIPREPYTVRVDGRILCDEQGAPRTFASKREAIEAGQRAARR